MCNCYLTNVFTIYHLLPVYLKKGLHTLNLLVRNLQLTLQLTLFHAEHNLLPVILSDALFELRNSHGLVENECLLMPHSFTQIITLRAQLGNRLLAELTHLLQAFDRAGATLSVDLLSLLLGLKAPCLGLLLPVPLFQKGIRVLHKLERNSKHVARINMAPRS